MLPVNAAYHSTRTRPVQFVRIFTNTCTGADIPLRMNREQTIVLGSKQARSAVILSILTLIPLLLTGCPAEVPPQTFEVWIINSLNVSTGSGSNNVLTVQMLSAVTGRLQVINSAPVESKTISVIELSVSEFGDSHSILVNAPLAGVIESLAIPSPLAAGDVLAVHVFDDGTGVNGAVEFLTVP